MPSYFGGVCSCTFLLLKKSGSIQYYILIISDTVCVVYLQMVV